MCRILAHMRIKNVRFSIVGVTLFYILLLTLEIYCDVDPYFRAFSTAKIFLIGRVIFIKSQKCVYT